MKMNHQSKFIICVAAIVVPVIVAGLFFPHSINQTFAVFMCGGPLYIYLGLARSFSAGEHFSIVLFCIVFSGYTATFLAPLYFIFRSYKRSLLIAQIGLVIVHFLITSLLIFGNN